MAKEETKLEEKTTNELPPEAPKKEEPKKIDYKARCADLEEQLELAKVKPSSCPKCMRADCCATK